MNAPTDDNKATANQCRRNDTVHNINVYDSDVSNDRN